MVSPCKPSLLQWGQWQHQNCFFLWGIEGTKCIHRGQKSQNLPKMADFAIFSSNWGGGGGKWGRASDWGGGRSSSCPHVATEWGYQHQNWGQGQRGNGKGVKMHLKCWNYISQFLFQNHQIFTHFRLFLGGGSPSLTLLLISISF